MNLKETIIEDLKRAMKEKNEPAKNALRVLKGEIERGEQSSKGKIDLTDQDIVFIAKKIAEGIKEVGGDTKELEAIEAYVPKQMSEEQIRSIVEAEVMTNGYNSMSDIRHIMQLFKENHAGQYDGKTVSTIFKETLN